VTESLLFFYAFHGAKPYCDYGAGDSLAHNSAVFRSHSSRLYRANGNDGIDYLVSITPGSIPHGLHPDYSTALLIADMPGWFVH